MSHQHGLSGESLDRYARMVQRSLAVPVALVSLVEQTRQHFIGAIGLPDPFMQTRETPLSHSFCQYVVKDEQPLVISDAREDDRLRDNLAIPDLGVVAYAGWPITDHTQRVVGSLCAIAGEPRDWTAEELDALADIAAACSAELTERGQREATDAALRAAEELGERSRLLLSISDRLATARTLPEVATAVDEVTRLELGCTHAGVWLREGDLDELDARPRPDEAVRSVRPLGGSWPGLERHHSLALDGSNPLGVCLTEGRSQYLRDVDELERRFPALKDSLPAQGARAVLALSIAGTTFGAIALAWPVERRFTLDDRRTLTALAAATAQAVQSALLLQDRVDVAETLQRAMLTSLPSVPGLELAARYRPAAVRDQVGGDWYDAVALPSGTTSVIIGDVIGHDIRAAAVMGQLRGMLRTLDWSDDQSPAGTVQRLDHAMADLGTDAVTSLVFAKVLPPAAGATSRQLTWTSAGHLPPVVLSPAGTAAPAGGFGASDLLLGINRDAVRRDHVLEVEDGSVALLFTDGLVERRGESLSVGMDRLLAAVEGLAGEELDTLLDELLQQLVGREHDDDVAVLAVRFVGADGPRPWGTLLRAGGARPPAAAGA